MSFMTNIMQQLNVQGAFEPVTTERIQLPNGKPIVGKKAVVDSNGAVLAVVSNKYRLVSNQEVFENFGKSLETSGLDLEGVKVQYSFKGPRSATSFIMPKHAVEIGKGDTTQLRLVVRNSHDGSWLLRGDVGGFRVACANGQVHGEFMSAFKSRHTNGLDFGTLNGGLTSALEMFAQMGERWLSYRNINLTEEQAMHAILKFFHQKAPEGVEVASMFDRKSGRSKLLESFNKYSGELGPNLLSLYNSFTDFASHSTPNVDGQVIKGKMSSDIIEAVYTELA